jgi:hypothetical protein
MAKFFFLLFFVLGNFSAQASDTIVHETVTFDAVIDALKSKFQEKSSEIRVQYKDGKGKQKNDPIKITSTKKEAIQAFITKYRGQIDEIRLKIGKFRKDTRNETLGNFIATILPPAAYPELDLLTNYDDYLYNVYATYYRHVLFDTDAYNLQLIERNLKRYAASLNLFYAVQACSSEGGLTPDTWVRYEEYIGSMQDSMTKVFNKAIGDSASRKAATRVVTHQCKEIKARVCKSQCQKKLCERGAIHGAMCKYICAEGQEEKHIKKCVEAYDSTYEGKQFPAVVLRGLSPYEALRITNAAELQRTKTAAYADPKYTTVGAFLEMIHIGAYGKNYKANPLP